MAEGQRRIGKEVVRGWARSGLGNVSKGLGEVREVIVGVLDGVARDHGVRANGVMSGRDSIPLLGPEPLKAWVLGVGILRLAPEITSRKSTDYSHRNNHVATTIPRRIKEMVQ